MRYYFSFLLLFLLVGTTLSCQKKKNETKSELDFSKNYTIDSSYNAAANELVVEIKLAPELHAYAEGEKIGKPVRLTVSDKNGWTPLGPAVIPPGKTKNLAGLGDSVILENNIRIRQSVKKGSGAGEAVLDLQVCTEKVCDRPRSHKVVLE